MIKLILILLFVINLQANRIWVERKPRFEYEVIRNFNCIDSNNCYAVADNSINWILYQSTDQGKTWENINEGGLELNGEWLFVKTLYIKDSSTFIITFAERFLLMKSENGGKSFEKVEFDVLSYKFNSSRAIDMIDHHGAIITYDYIALTKDNWETIDTITRPSFEESYKQPGSNIYFIDSTQFICNRWANRSADFVVYDIEKKNGNNTVTFYMRILIVVITPEGCMISKL